MAHLIPCTDCARHVQSTDSACPFCGATLAKVAALPLPPRGVSRAAAIAFGATLVVACSGGTGPAPDQGDGGTDGSTNTSSSSTSSAYGGPPIDSGPQDDGGTQAAYGAPATEDAGKTDSGGGS